MKCPECVKTDQRSTVTPGFGSSTLLGYTPGHYDEDGNYVQHQDPNYHTYTYSCSNGHHFSTVTRMGKTWLGQMFTPEEERVYL